MVGRFLEKSLMHYRLLKVPKSKCVGSIKFDTNKLGAISIKLPVLSTSPPSHHKDQSPGKGNIVIHKNRA